MADYRTGFLYSLSPIHCGSSGDIGNVLEIAREVHTNFPYIPGSSLRGSVRDEITNYFGNTLADRLFGKQLDESGTMGVHQIWFGDARLLWIPMRTMCLKEGSRDAFAWISCPTLLKGFYKTTIVSDKAIGTKPGKYLVADAEIKVEPMNEDNKNSLTIVDFPEDLKTIGQAFQQNRIVLPDDDFSILLEHALWTQIRNKIDESGSAEVFWTDVCIPRDTIFLYHWGYTASKNDPLTSSDWNNLLSVIRGIFQVGGQANIGRGWVQSWTDNHQIPAQIKNSQEKDDDKEQ